jgi:hypothetical protein
MTEYFTNIMLIILIDDDVQDADSDAHDHMRSSADAELVAMRVELGAAAGENEDVVSFIRAVTCTLCYSLFN